MLRYIDTLDLDYMSDWECGLFTLDELFAPVEEHDVDPVLFDDPSPPLYSSRIESELNFIIDIQERMAKGSKLIDECQAKLDWFKDGHWVPKETFMAWVARKKKFISHWKELMHECIEFIGDDKYLWKLYFQLRDEPLDPRNITGDPEEIDSQRVIFMDSRDQMEELLISDIASRMSEDDPLKPWEEVPYKRLSAYTESLMESMEDK